MSREIFETRRSVNFFDTTKDLDEATFQQIMDLAVLAPSAFNLQPWRIIAVRTPEAKEKLHAVAMKQDKVKEAPYTLIIVGDRSGYEKSNKAWEAMEKSAGKDAVEGAQGFAASLYGTSEERKIKFAESNAGLFGMSIMYAAKTLGVDSHGMSGIDFEGVKKVFGLRESEEVVMLVTLGYHDKSKELYPRSWRRKGTDLIEVV